MTCQSAKEKILQLGEAVHGPLCFTWLRLKARCWSFLMAFGNMQDMRTSKMLRKRFPMRESRGCVIVFCRVREAVCRMIFLSWV